ncbi:MAG TPA: transglycosylase domain-containing protein [Streptosporangiaceae bacterium]
MAALAFPAAVGLGALTRAGARLIAPVAFSDSALPQRSVIEARGGQVIGTFFTQDRTDIPPSKVAPVMRRSIVAIEDSRFWTNGPLDLRGTLRAIVHDHQDPGQVQGASTLVQQYVKNVLEDDAAQRMTVGQDEMSSSASRAERAAAEAAYRSAKAAYARAGAPDIGRKITELRYAIWVEQHRSKQQILGDYLNTVWFGGSSRGDNSVYGIEAAAEYYFSEHASQLSLRQSALLAGMVNNAQLYDPEKHPASAISRRNTVLARMAQLGDITPAQAAAAGRSGLRLHLRSPGGSCGASRYPFFCEYVRDEVAGDPALGVTPLRRLTVLDTGGLRIRTTLRVRAQRGAQRAMDAMVSPGSRFVGMEAMVEPGTGDIEAIAQTRRYGYGPHRTTIDYAADDAHGGLGSGVQAGSTFKLYTLLAALTDGYPATKSYPTPYAMQLSGFSDCHGTSVGAWPVHNAEPSDGKTNTLITATWKSVNTYYAQLERSVGLCAVAAMAARLGMVNPGDGSPLNQETRGLDNMVPSYTLGSNGIDLVHQSAAYAAVAARGRYCSPVAVTSMTRPAGLAGTGRRTRLPVPPAGCHRVISAGVADEATQILRGVLTQPSGTAYGDAPPGRAAAGKTGTTDNEAMALFAGYTPQLSAVVWYGDPGSPFGDPTGQFGEYTAPFWEQSMTDALQGQPVIDFAGVTARPPAARASGGPG